MTTGVLAGEVERAADPAAAGRLLERVAAGDARTGRRLEDDPSLRAALVAVGSASGYLARVCVTDPGALDVLADLDTRPELDPDRLAAGNGPAAAEIARFKALEMLRVAARDLLGLDALDGVVAAITRLAEDVLAAAWGAAGGAAAGLAVVGMGKLGARELNYASDIDIVLVGSGDPRPMLELARAGWRVDLDLRPEGRAGPLTRTLESWLAYWDRWAHTWEFQALLKARPVSGDAPLGAAWAAEAAARVWGRPFGADELRQVRAMKGRAEAEVARRGLTDREVKTGRGGIRDIEFAVQLLQMVHGRADPTLRPAATLDALDALAAGGYVAAGDAASLAGAYRWLRLLEHRLQLADGQQVHAVPTDPASRERLARVLGFRDNPRRRAVASFEETLRAHQATVRSIHERLFFRPLLEAFSAGNGAGAPAAGGAPSPPAAGGALSPDAVAERLAAFGFSDAARTRQAVRELTRGVSRSSRLWQQLLPLVLGWLSESPDPDLGLLGLRAIAGAPHSRDQLTAVVRESAEAARRLCLLLGTGPVFGRALARRPDLLRGLDPPAGPSSERHLAAEARRNVQWRAATTAGAQEGLVAFRRDEELRVAARDVLGGADVEETGRDLAALAGAVLAEAVRFVDPQIPFAVIAMGSLGGRELSYTSDLDVLLVYDTPTGAPADAARAAEAAGSALMTLVNGETPARRVYRLDTQLRPEGRQGPLVRSLGSYARYYGRWAETWERQALLRGRFLAGDEELGRRFAAVAGRFVWGTPVGPAEVRAIRRTKARVELERIPAGEDPQFHLKLGRGSLSDVEWTVQLLQLVHGVPATGTLEALSALEMAGALDPDDALVLAGAYRFCQHTRNRLALVRGTPGDSLPSTGAHLTTLARSLGTTATGLREDYRRVTRRARRVVERLFYGQDGETGDRR